jgi:hypothetical protein
MFFNISLTLYSSIVRVVGYVILYSVGIITCKLVCKIVLICPNLTVYLKFFKMSVKSLLGFKFSITLNPSMKKVLLSRKRTFEVLYKNKKLRTIKSVS